MKIFFNQSYSLSKQAQPTKQPNFNGGGKPIDLRYIYQKHQKIIPPRVLKEVESILKRNPKDLPSLIEVHKKNYAPLLECETLEQAKEMFPEFEGIDDVKIAYQKRSFKDENPKLDIRNNFALTVLQEYWAKLRTQDEIAKDFGLGSRNTLKWALDKVGFIGFNSIYKTILKSSDVERNKLIASKTSAWNALHPDLMYAKNKHAAQFNKKPEYRARQSQLMKEYDIAHPERKEKISRFSKLTWQKCPEVAKAMSDFVKDGSAYLKKVVKKQMTGVALSESEKRASKGFFARFWQAYPDMKLIYQEARRAASEEIRAQNKNLKK